MIYHHHKQQSGVIIILAVVLTGVLFSVAIALAVIVISDLRQAQSIDRSIVAYYAAESGLERTLFALRKDHDNSLVIVDNMKAVKDELFTGGGLDSSESSWDISNSDDYEQIFSRQRLLQGQSAKLYILNRPSNETNRIKITWKQGRVDQAIKLQVVMTQLTPQPQPDLNNALVYYTDFDSVFKDDRDELCLPLLDADIDGTGTTAPNDYSIELRSLGDSDLELVDEVSDLDFIKSLEVTTFKGDNCTDANNANLDGLTNLTIVSDGDKDGAGQTIFAHILPRDPISGILGFVLFSEEDITKGY